MKTKLENPSRRRALKMVAGGAVLIPVGALVAHGTALASDLPKVEESDPVAQGLNYRHDATQAARVDKAGVPAAEQLCKSCALAQGEGEWVGCAIFPGKAVNANGWCTGWVPRAG